MMENSPILAVVVPCYKEEAVLHETHKPFSYTHLRAKWKRLTLAEYHIEPGYGIYTDMNAIRADEEDVYKRQFWESTHSTNRVWKHTRRICLHC